MFVLLWLLPVRGWTMPDRTGYEPRIVAHALAKKEGGRCDHCRQVVSKGAPVVKVIESCCQRHEARPSRKSGGKGNWVCEDCVDAIEAVPIGTLPDVPFA